jgi:hypothetical protein
MKNCTNKISIPEYHFHNILDEYKELINLYEHYENLLYQYPEDESALTEEELYMMVVDV